MMRKTSYLMMGAALGVSMSVAVSSLDLSPSGPAVAASSETYRQLGLFGDVFERVRDQYVESPDDAKLIEAAINGMLTSLDPHSAYLDTKSYRDLQVQTRGEFGGLGIEVTMEKGALKVISPIDETPAARAGILANDIILSLNGEMIEGLTLNQAVEKMRGPVNTPITLKIQRGEGTEPIEVRVVRDLIRIRAVRHRIEGDIGYVRVTQFNENTFESLKAALDDIQKKVPQNLKGYVIDLRNNPGGLLDQAISVSDAFLDRGEIVSTRGRQADQASRVNAKAGDLTKGKPLVVLVNGGSASASEIVAGALQDHRRATVVGTRSFGKGSVQTILPLGSNGAIRLTTARYYTPAGRSIQAKGIDPDIQVVQELPPELKGKEEARSESTLRGHLTAGEGEEQKGSSAYVPQDPKDDQQLAYAMDLLRGIKVNSAFPPNPKRAAN